MKAYVTQLDAATRLLPVAQFLGDDR
jgi:hypothetical protein